MLRVPWALVRAWFDQRSPVGAGSRGSTRTSPCRFAARSSHAIASASRPAAAYACARSDGPSLQPGSWFTSVLPHLLVPELADALISTRARRLVALNLVPQLGETGGFSPHTHLEVLADHAKQVSAALK